MSDAVPRDHEPRRRTALALSTLTRELRDPASVSSIAIDVSRPLLVWSQLRLLRTEAATVPAHDSNTRDVFRRTRCILRPYTSCAETHTEAEGPTD